MFKRSLKFAAAAASVALLMAACAPDMPDSSSDGNAAPANNGSTAGGQAPAEVTNLIVAPSSPMGPHWAAFAVAEEQGYFAENGVDVELQFPGGSADVLQAVATDRVHIGVPSPEAVWAAVDNGQTAKMYYNWSREAVQALAVLEDSDFQSFADLKGANIGVAAISSGAKLIAESALRDEGIDPTEVTFIATGTGVAAADALSRGQVDALMLWDTEFVLMEQSGLKLRTFLPDDLAQLFSTGFATSQENIDSMPEALGGFGRAWSQATVWATENPEGAIEALWKHYPQTKTADGEDFLQQQVEIFEARNQKAMYGDPMDNMDFGVFPEAGVTKWMEFAAEYGMTTKKLEITDVYTNEFAEAFNDFDVEEIREAAAADQG